MTKTYLVLLIDKKHTKFFILRGQSVERIVEKRAHEHIPQKVKHGDDTWDATDKIFRHIQVHLHRYLQNTMKEVTTFVGNEHVDGVFIGSHKALFPKIKEHLPQKLQKKVVGCIVLDLKTGFNIQLGKIKKEIAFLDQQFLPGRV